MLLFAILALLRLSGCASLGSQCCAGSAVALVIGAASKLSLHNKMTELDNATP